MRKIISILLSVFMLVTALTVCVHGDAGKNGKLSIVTTIFPEYDWVMNILGENAENADVTMLLDSGVDLHSYQPTVDDIIKISTCDIFIYVGGESDEWVEDALKEAVSKDMVVINLLESLGDAVKEEEVVEGMEHDHEHEHEEEHDGEHEEEHDGEHEEDHEHEEGHDEDHDHEHEEEHHHETDEHVWLSLRNAKELCGTILGALCKTDPANSDMYQQNADSYIAKLTELDTKYQEAVNAASVKTLLFGDRFPFRYLVDDYGLNYYAAFSGCSAETEASFETVVFLAGKVDELGLSSVLTLEGTDQRIAETVIAATTAKSAQIRSMDSMQSITAADVKNGVTYLAVMEKNLEVLKEALK